jgi:hypothetical protein
MDTPSQSGRLIIIGGAPRSGTTLLQNMLDCHAEVLGGPEFLHLPDIIELRKKLRTSLDRKWINLICSYEDVDNRIREMIEGFLISFANKQNTRLLSEKTPESVLVFSELAEVLPDARFIHVVRDPRATIASLLEVGKKAKQKGKTPPAQTRNINAAIKAVKKSLEEGLGAIEKVPDRLLTIRYEDLASEPEAVTKKVCSFLQIEWQPEMCAPGEKKHIGEQAITVNSGNIWYDKASYNRNPTTESLEKWKQSLSPTQQIDIFNAFSSDSRLSKLGYNLSIEHLTTSKRIISAAIILVKRLRSSLSRIIKRAIQS